MSELIVLAFDNEDGALQARDRLLGIQEQRMLQLADAAVVVQCVDHVGHQAAGGVAAGLLALVLGQALLRLRGAYFALATIGINQATRAFVNNFDPFGGPIGMRLNFQAYWML